jgi:hypothetical protein
MGIKSAVTMNSKKVNKKGNALHSVTKKIRENFNGEKKSASTTRSDVKKEIVKLEQKQLVMLVGDLFRLSKENKSFVNARFAVK